MEDDVDLNAVADLQGDAGLNVALETIGLDFELIRADGKVGQRVVALWIGNRGTDLLFIDFGDFDLGTGDSATGGIRDSARDFGDGDCLGQRTCWSKKSNKKDKQKGKREDVLSRHVVLPLPSIQKIGGSISLFPVLRTAEVVNARGLKTRAG